MENYKENIAATRQGCLGSSDGMVLLQVAVANCVPKSAYKRMAVVKGLIPQEEIPRTDAIKAGDDVEMMVFNHLKAMDDRYESNPLWVSEKYSKKNVKLISHPDLVLVDEEHKAINVYEVKTTKFNYEQTRQTYKAQLFIHNVIAKEKAIERGSEWTARLFLVHYSTDGLDLSQGVDFDPSRLTIKRVQFASAFFDVNKAMTIVDAFLDDFTEYYDGDEIDSAYLPDKVKQEFDVITNALVEIKEREQKVEEFKRKLYDFMLDKNVKGIRSEEWSITRIDASESKSFDGKKYLADLKALHPRKAKKIEEKYIKNVARGGYVKILVRKDNKS